ncbi:MAG TPA: T9SS type A sorting domain-containing protein, partial [Bacteroidota bacterium]|nr:T9SS type A sorting domain-containing protein [Bacteroidota bacterium]
GSSSRAIRAACIMFAALSVFFFTASDLIAQPNYRTFNQVDLAAKKATAGKVLGSRVTFTFVNPRLTPVQGFHAIISKKIVAIIDSGGFTDFTIEKNRIVDATGPNVASGESVTVAFTVMNRKPGTVANFFWWTDADGHRKTSTEYKVPPILDEQDYVQPNGGNLRDFLYKKIIQRPEGLVLGIVAPDQGVGWIRNMSANGKYFTHTGPPRCLDYTVSYSGRMKPITRQLRNLHFKKHNNHLLGELHALKLAIIANDAGITEPTDPAATKIGDLIYNNPSDPGNPFNGRTVRDLAHLTDSALTFCGSFAGGMYPKLDTSITRINKQFDGPYHALSFDPFLLAGTQGLNQALYLHPNPHPPPGAAGFRSDDLSIVEEVPAAYVLTQNYPNPFNPTTSIEFSLAEPGIVTLKVYDLLGREVATLIDHEEYDDGEQLVNFDADGLTSGMYFYRLTSNGTGDRGGHFDEIRKMVLMK